MSADALAGYPRTVVLTDGAHLELRPLAPADAPALGAFFARLDADERWHLRHDVADPVLADAFARGADPARVATVVALDDGRIVAQASLRRRDGHHVTEVRLVLDPAYRGRRLGTWMLLDCVHLAGTLGAERLVAEVPAHQAAFLAALRRLDFVEEARRGPGGAPGTTVVLVKQLHAGWTDF